MNEGDLQFDPTAASGDELMELVVLHLEGRLAGPQRVRLNALLAKDPCNRDTFVAVCTHASLLASCVGIDEDVNEDIEWLEMVDSSAIDASVGEAVELPLQPEPPALPFPSLSTTHYPLPTNFVGGPVFSYMVATLILGVMLLGAWAYKITQFQSQIVKVPSKSVSSDVRPELVFVGRISGMKDCRWSDPQTEAYAGASVPLNRKYALASGLMEITYKTGAKVILEGPCTYEVDSHAGGYLASGKLTARIEERREKIARNRNLSVSLSSPLSPLPSPLFSVRTPTAIVTDLGTEFGVKVNEKGDTTSYVFRGSVKVQVTGNGPQKDVVLRANESALVIKGTGSDNSRLVIGNEAGVPPKFVRWIYEPPKVLDLLDIVAGGNGIRNYRERGIDPTTGWEDPLFVTRTRDGKGRYLPVGWHRLIDGVFVPDGGDGAVQLDSFGHKFDGIPDTVGRTCGSIWARAAEVKPDERAKDVWNWVYFIGRGEQFMPNRRGLLGFHANSGITFDLAAMRKRYPDVRPARFRATAGMADASDTSAGAGMADLWIFVDGRLKLKREKIRPQDGTFNVDVELGPNDRFLTLAATDSGNGITSDWLVLGDPLLEMTTTELEKSSVPETHQNIIPK